MSILIKLSYKVGLVSLSVSHFVVHLIHLIHSFSILLQDKSSLSYLFDQRNFSLSSNMKLFTCTALLALTMVPTVKGVPTNPPTCNKYKDFTDFVG